MPSGPHRVQLYGLIKGQKAILCFLNSYMKELDLFLVLYHNNRLKVKQKGNVRTEQRFPLKWRNGYKVWLK